jgi:hypothetical protein
VLLTQLEREKTGFKGVVEEGITQVVLIDH